MASPSGSEATHHATTPTAASNPIPKSHVLAIRHTWDSLTNNSDDEKATKKRVHKAGEILALPDNGGILQTIGPGNLKKKTFCYKMITSEGIEYFVKIFEDSKMSPTKVSKKLFTDKNLKCKFKPYLLLPAFKPKKTPLDAHTYEVVIYPFIKHCNFQDITLKALRQGYINPLYHRSNPIAKAHAVGYKMRMLKKFKQCINIAIVMKDNGNGYVDMDISPDNWIIPTDLPNAADNDNIRWDQITDAKGAKCIKIDHESMLKWEKQFRVVQKPMKNNFKPPEVNVKESFDVEKANVYQFGATFVYVLYGQLKDNDSDGNEYWMSLPVKGKGDWKNEGWNPKYVDLQWLQRCIDGNPRKRPGFDRLLQQIQWELDKMGQGPSKSSNFVKNGGNGQRKVNTFNNFINNGGQVTIVHNGQSLRQSQGFRQMNRGYQQQIMQQQQMRRNIPRQNQQRLRQNTQQRLRQNTRQNQSQSLRQQPRRNFGGAPDGMAMRPNQQLTSRQSQQQRLRPAQNQNQFGTNEQRRTHNLNGNNQQFQSNNQRQKPGNNRKYNNF